MFFRKLNLVLGLVLLCSLVPVRSSVDPKSYASIYVGLVKNISNEQLVKNYREDLSGLENPQAKNDLLSEESRLVQLPIYRVPVLKVIVGEMQRRNLISGVELSKAQKLIKEKEEQIKKGGK